MEWIADALKDSLSALPFLFAAYLLIEFLEHSDFDRLKEMLIKPHALKPAFAALLGCFPQCGISAAAANLYSSRIISLGCLIAVYLACSDEAIPLFLANAKFRSLILPLIACKLVIGIFAGVLIDKIVPSTAEEEKKVHHLWHSETHHHSLLQGAIEHTVEIFLIILCANLILGFLFETVSLKTVSSLLLKGSIFQPVITVAIGLIPNCASTVFLVELFEYQTISFAALIGGLCANAGIGLVVLYRSNKNIKENIRITVLLAAISLVSALILGMLI